MLWRRLIKSFIIIHMCTRCFTFLNFLSTIVPILANIHPFYILRRVYVTYRYCRRICLKIHLLLCCLVYIICDICAGIEDDAKGNEKTQYFPQRERFSEFSYGKKETEVSNTHQTATNKKYNNNKQGGGRRRYIKNME